MKRCSWRATNLEIVAFFVVAICFVPIAICQAQDPEKPKPLSTASLRGTLAGEERDDNGLQMKLVWCPPGNFKMGPSEEESKIVKGRLQGFLKQTQDRVKKKVELGGAQKNDLLGLAIASVAINRDSLTPFHFPEQVDVQISKGFWIGKFEMTQAQWVRLVRVPPWQRLSPNTTRPPIGENYPCVFISFNDAYDFCSELTKAERRAKRLPPGWKYSLPTEAQWEYACRAGTNTMFSFGEDSADLGNFAVLSENSGDSIAEVGTRKPNPWGIHDMYGNVAEWCRDTVPTDLNKKKVSRLRAGKDPRASKDSDLVHGHRIVRGGSYTSGFWQLRSASRSDERASVMMLYNGFRICLTEN